MRTMLRVCMDVDASNRALHNGALQKTMQDLEELIHPEASYFTTEGGKRTAYYFFQLADPSQIPQIVEPLFNVLGAEIDLKPVMNGDDLRKGLQKIDLKAA